MTTAFPGRLLIQAALALNTEWASLRIVYWSKSKKTSANVAISAAGSRAAAGGVEAGGASLNMVGGVLGGLSPEGAGAVSTGGRAVSMVALRSSGTVIMLSGLIVSTGATALVPLVAEAASPADA